MRGESIYELLGCRLTFHVPRWEDQYCRMTAKSTSENLCAFHTKIHAITLNGGNRGLWDTRELRKLILAKLLELSHDSNRITD
mgnify:CR=1 FL=1